MESRAAIVASKVSKSFGEGEARTQAVDAVDFVARFGEMVFIVGPSGSGKTTFLSLISGILRPDSGTVAIDVSHMKDGDFAGLAAFQRKYGFVGVKVSGEAKSIVMVSAESNPPVEVESVPLAGTTAFLKLDCDFKDRADKAYFFYSLDGSAWKAIGKPLHMSYTLPHFMGYRFALFNYATKTVGGSAAFDYFRVSEKLTGNH